MQEEHIIQVLEKPDWVSWDEIHDVLWKAHEQNRENGIMMALPSLSGEKIKEMIGNTGKMFVAIDGDKVVGTFALIKKTGDKWYCRGVYGYLCFAAVLPEYTGKGIYRSLYQRAETTAKQMELPVLIRDTNEHNDRMLKISKKEGYYYVDYKICKDHYNIIRAKWLNGRPYTEFYIKYQYLLRMWYKKLRYKPGKIKRFGI